MRGLKPERNVDKSLRSSAFWVLKMFLDGAVVAFRQLNLAVREKEILCIVGPSGCGKTTFLRCIAGLTDLTGGNCWCTASRSPARRDGVAMVFQHFGLLPWKTVYDNAAFGLAMARRAGRAHQGARRALSRSGRPQGLRAALSLSALRRHAAARRPGARARDEPVMLLMDEPFAALDAQTREVLQEELLRSWSARTSARPWCSSPIRSTRRSCSATASR
jgi:NitT/TauT family transport system ATP-binding protein